MYLVQDEGITKTSQLINDSGFLTSHQDISGKVDKIGVSNVLRYPETTGYLKFAECDLSVAKGYGNKYIVLFVTTEYGTATKVNNGIIFINIRGNGANPSSVSDFYWFMKNNQSPSDNGCLCWAANGFKVEFYRKAYSTTEYSQVSFKIMHVGDFESGSKWNFNLINVPFIAGTPLDTPIGEVHNIEDKGYVLYASNASSATKASQDAGGNNIINTYATKTELGNKQDKITATNKLDYSLLSGTPTIPSAVTESTVSGWGFTKNTGTYSKPSGGIPKTDLASAVQTSLGKADTALQEHQSLEGYVKNTDYANSSNAGVIKTGSYGMGITNGKLYATSYSSAQFETLGDTYFVSKGTLSNVLTDEMSKKQDTLTAGSNIKIESNVISADSSLPQNSVIKYDGDTIPEGFELIGEDSEQTMEVYSTNEQIIGYWIDNKPIYRKVITTTLPTVSTDGTYPSNKSVAVGASVSTIVNLRGIMVLPNSGKPQSYVLPYINNSGRIAKMFHENSNILLAANGTAFSNASVTIIIEYTKNN